MLFNGRQSSSFKKKISIGIAVAVATTSVGLTAAHAQTVNSDTAAWQSADPAFKAALQHRLSQVRPGATLSQSNVAANQTTASTTVSTVAGVNKAEAPADVLAFRQSVRAHYIEVRKSLGEIRTLAKTDPAAAKVKLAALQADNQKFHDNVIKQLETLSTAHTDKASFRQLLAASKKQAKADKLVVDPSRTGGISTAEPKEDPIASGKITVGEVVPADSISDKVTVGEAFDADDPIASGKVEVGEPFDVGPAQ